MKFNYTDPSLWPSLGMIATLPFWLSEGGIVRMFSFGYFNIHFCLALTAAQFRQIDVDQSAPLYGMASASMLSVMRLVPGVTIWRLAPPLTMELSGAALLCYNLWDYEQRSTYVEVGED